MRIPALILLLVICNGFVIGQDTLQPSEGTVSFVTSQSVYVKFEQTRSIQPGDTLFTKQASRFIPALVVRERSSLSCVCERISSRILAVSDRVYHLTRSRPTVSHPPPSTPPPSTPLPSPLPPPSETRIVTPPEESRTDTASPPAAADQRPQQIISGFASIASFTNFSTNTSSNSERLKYTVAFNIRNIGRTGLSAESYLVFSHDNQNWSEIQDNIFNGLKIYNLSLNYDFSRHFRLLAGRKINPKLTGMGAVDGLQFEMRFKPLSIGLIAGFRPDYSNYGFSGDLFQYGGYLYNEFGKNKNRFMTTLGYIEQLNQWKTDRRYIYFQHSNTLIGRINIFASFDLDLYNQTFDTIDSTFHQSGAPNLTNLYLSFNYRIIKQLSVSFSYSARQQVVYYESNKSYLARLLEEATLQGYMLNITVRPVDRLSIGVTGAYRFMKDEDPRRTKNVYAYISYSRIPGIGITPTLSFTWLQTAYMQGPIYSAGIARDFAKGKVSAGLSYRYVDYRFSYSETPLPQNMIEADLSWRIIRKLSLSLFYEGTFEPADRFNRIYAQLNYRF